MRSPDRGIGCGFHLSVGNMLGRMPVGRKPPGKSGRQLRVHKETHQAMRNTG
jgi:hypothetical protein